MIPPVFGSTVRVKGFDSSVRGRFTCMTSTRSTARNERLPSDDCAAPPPAAVRDALFAMRPSGRFDPSVKNKRRLVSVFVLRTAKYSSPVELLYEQYSKSCGIIAKILELRTWLSYGPVARDILAVSRFVDCLSKRRNTLCSVVSCIGYRPSMRMVSPIPSSAASRSCRCPQ